PIEREWFVMGARYQALDDEVGDYVGIGDERRADALRNQPSDDQRIKTLERSEHALYQPAALGRLGIGVAKMVKPGRQSRFSIHGDGVLGLGIGHAEAAEACQRSPEPPADEAPRETSRLASGMEQGRHVGASTHGLQE